MARLFSIKQARQEVNPLVLLPFLQISAGHNISATLCDYAMFPKT
jgi:hypothetical protein